MSKYKVKLNLSYDGTSFCGWQKQPNNSESIQQHLEGALTRIFDETIKVVGAGRTDAGVHAYNQYAHFWTSKDPSKYNLLYGLNGVLMPPQIVTKQAWVAPEEFHAISSIKKTYKYLLLNRPQPSAFRHNYTTFHRKPIDIDYLNVISQLIIGEHEFKSFQTSGTDSKTTIKNIQEARWSRINPDLVCFTITGDGFLRQMVRNIVGTLLWMHRNNCKVQELQDILDSQDRQRAKDTAPPQGLYLAQVYYKTELDNKCRKI